MYFSQRTPSSLGKLCLLSLVMILVLSACGNSASTSAGNAQNQHATTMPMATPTIGKTPISVVGTTEPPTETSSGILPCPPALKATEVVANFNGNTGGLEPEEANDPHVNKVAEVTPTRTSCGGALAVKTTLFGSSDNDSLRHTVLLSAQFAQRNLYGWQFGCRSWFPRSMASFAAIAYYAKVSAVDSNYRNNESNDDSGTIAVIKQNTGVWLYSFVNIGQSQHDMSKNSDGIFDPKNVIAFSLAVKSKPGSPAFAGSYYYADCVLINHWHPIS